jgi:RNA polymerase sigma factor (sigma-70 family)
MALLDTIDESAVVDALRLAGERPNILTLQGLGLWKGDLSEMRRDSPRRRVDETSRSAPEEREAHARLAKIRRVREAMGRLPARRREVLRLRYVEGLPVEEIAGRLGVSVAYTGKLIAASLRLFGNLLGAKQANKKKS